MLSYWDEQWRPVPGFEWGYYVSDFGRVKGPRKMLKGVDNGQGYLMVRLYKRRSTKKHYWLVHRLVALAFLEKLSPDADEVHHKDGNPANNHIDNLEWVKSSAHSRAGVRQKQKDANLFAD